MFKPDSPEEKIAKGEHILSKATQLLRENGAEGLSMNKLAEACNVAKGTLYLYFKTREEIIGAIYLSVFWNWLNALPQTLTTAQTYQDFCEAYCTSLTTDPLLVPLMTEAQTRTQFNVPLETFVEFKRSQAEGLDTLAGHFATTLKIDDTKASQLVWAFQVATLGAAHYLRTPDIAPDDLPQDTHALTYGLNFEAMFLNSVTQLSV